MLNDRTLRNFATYLAVTPSRDLGKRPNPVGAYDSKSGARGHGFGLSMRHFDRGGAFDFEGAKPGGERYANGQGERYARGRGERDDGAGARQAKDDGDREVKLREWCKSMGLSDRDCEELMQLLGLGGAGDDVDPEELLDDHNAMDSRFVRPANSAARAAFDKANGITARRPRLLG
jgi:hypothetical protein